MKQISHTTAIQLNDTPDKILPLFTAYGETLWIIGWNPNYVYPEDGETQTGAIWTTQHNIDEPETIWVTVTYDITTHSASYINVTAHQRVTRIDIQCHATENNQTSAQIIYTVTALGEEGVEFIKKFTQEHYEHWIQHGWRDAINHYLASGEASIVG